MKKLITVFGDSIGKGIMTDGEKLFFGTGAVDILKGEYDLKIENKSSYGQSLKRIMAREEIDKYYQTATADKSERVAVLELGGNDADFDWKKVAADPKGEHTSKTTPEEFFSLYKSALEKLSFYCTKVYVCSLVPVESGRFFKNVISRTADGNKVLEYFNGDVNTVYRHQEIMNNLVVRAADSKGYEVIDLRYAFLKSLDFSSLMCLDGIHPNANGQKLIASSCRRFAAV